MLIEYTKKIKSHKCTICETCFASKAEMKQHVEAVHGEKKQCTICYSYFSGKKILRRHIATVHGGEKPSN